MTTKPVGQSKAAPQSEAQAAAPAAKQAAVAAAPKPDTFAQKTSAELDAKTSSKVTPGNRVTPYVDGDKAFPEILKTINEAGTVPGKPKTLDYETYELHSHDQTTQQVVGALIAASERGVKVRVVVDGVGANERGPLLPFQNDAVDQLQRAGIEVRKFHELKRPTDLADAFPRDHRKTIISGKDTAWIGGMNTGDDYMGKVHRDRYHDIHARLEGPAVGDLVSAFNSTWEASGGSVTPEDRRLPEISAKGDDQVRVVTHTPGKDNDIEDVYLTMIKNAKSSILVENAFKMTPKMVDALVGAKARGVPVTCIVDWDDKTKLMTDQEDPRDVYGALINGGVRVVSYPHRTHVKALVADEFATLGSSNTDQTSLVSNQEEIMVIQNPEKAATLRQILEADAVSDGQGNKSKRIFIKDIQDYQDRKRDPMKPLSDLDEWWNKRTW